jgi:hypothetical protein
MGTLIEMTEPIGLPLEIEQVAELLSRQRAEVRELFRYALVLAMIDEEKAHVIGTRLEEGIEFLPVETVAGDVFDIKRPEISEEVEADLMKKVRAIVADEEAEGPKNSSSSGDGDCVQAQVKVMWKQQALEGRAEAVLSEWIRIGLHLLL